jgi:hypothetical protein
MFLETWVVPVCLYDQQGATANIRELFGTAFFINNRGHFMTARHVVESVEAAAQSKSLDVGLVIKLDNGASAKSGIVPILHRAFAPEPFDIVVGLVDYRCKTHLAFEEIAIEVWQDIATYGYPINAVSGDPGELNLNIRCHKGYIQRLTKPADIPFGSHPEGFELSFLLSQGLSGAPVFVYKGDRDVVIGVSVGSIRSEIVEDKHEQIEEDGRIFRETRLKIDEYGLAHDIRSLLGWLPAGFNGLSLLQLSRLPGV